MVPLVPIVPTLVISVVYCLYNAHRSWSHQRRDRILRERVAYMLWCAAEKVEVSVE